MKKLLSLFLCMMLVLANASMLHAEETETTDNNEDRVVLSMEDLDAASLGIKKLGEEVSQTGSVPEQEIDFNEVVRVSIVLDSDSTLDAGYSAENIAENVAAVSYRDQLKAQQAAVTRAIENAIGETLDVKWNLTLAVNIISANVQYKNIETIRNIEGVKDVFVERQYEPQEDEVNTASTSTFMVGAAQAWADGYTGAGSRIAIIDTGIDTSHQSFDGDAFSHSIAELGKTDQLMTQISETVANQLNSKSNNYVSTKIPYGYNYVDRDTKITHMETGDNQGNHGSHVAGIAAANKYIKNGNSYERSIDYAKAVGMAPDAQLLIMKVFGRGGGAYDSDYMAAIEDAIVLGADSVNLSLGSANPGWTYDSAYQDVLNSLASDTNLKTVVTISAGNSYSYTANLGRDLYIEDVNEHTGGSPGSYINSFGVAAVDNIGATGTPMLFNGKNIFYDATAIDMATIPGTYDLVYIDALGNAADYQAVNAVEPLSGKIVIVNRGELNFSDKANNSKSYSPKGLIIANNVPGMMGMDLSDFTGSFPVVSISLADAQYIKENSTAHTTGSYTYYTGSITVTDTMSIGQVTAREDAVISEFSSWGVPGSLIMKPEIAAPGGNIWSVYGTGRTSSGATEGGSDQYVSYSGTSMAAPHMTGLAAVVAQYLRENPISNDALTGNYNTRTIVQSLLMSTATPMKNDGEYVSILEQGAGLAEVSKAIRASSVMMMGTEDDTLTAKTGSAADGKVKAEFGEDADKTGVYTYSFTLYNISDFDLSYELSTKLFTQDHYDYNGLSYMDTVTTAIENPSVSYQWETKGDQPTEGHDVDMDGDTDTDDVQAILDYLSGLREEETIDPEAGDMDSDEMLTSYDAHLLLNWEAESSEYPANTVKAHDSRKVTVTIALTDANKQWLDGNYPNGAYIEGFTYATASGSSNEGLDLAHEHTIPLIGFYGNWTDSSMFDNNSYIETLYGSTKVPYASTADTNYLVLTSNGKSRKFSGNPYMVEEEFPVDKLAVNTETTFDRFTYSLLRAAATTGFAVTELDESQGDVTNVISANVTGNEVDGLWFHVNNGTWQNTGTKNYNINKKVSSFGLSEGDVFRIGFYAIPEYYGMMQHEDDLQDADAGLLDSSEFRTVLTENALGKGAYVGYDFTIDNTAPQITTATLSGSTLTIEASDNINLAYVAVLSLDGTVKYKEAAPGQKQYSVSLDISDAIESASGYVAVYAGDYAGNESAKAIKVNDNTHVEKTVFVLTSELVVGEDYLIVSRNAAGSGYALSHTTSTTATVDDVTVKEGNGLYIDAIDVDAASIWTVGNGSTSGTYIFENDGYFIRRSNSNALTITKDTSRRDWTWDATNNRLANNSRYLRFYNNTFSLNTAVNSVYLFRKADIEMDVNPDTVSSVSVTPQTLDIYKGNQADVTATVSPLTVEDRSVTWSSSDESIATVDENGRVTGIAAGTAEIIATSNADSSKSASCVVTVTLIDKELSAIIWDEEGQVFFSKFNTKGLPEWTKRTETPVTLDDNPLYLHNAYMMNASTLYASTLDVSDTSVIYSVNRNNYSVTEFGTNFVPAFGMARVGSRYDSDYYVYPFANYLIFGNLPPEEDEEYGYLSGFPYGLLDLTETNVGDAYAVGICARTVSTTSANYYFLDETGKIWQVSQNASSFGNPTLFVDTGLSAGLEYQSLYYDGSYIYWSRQVDNISEMIIINGSTKAIYHAGDFGEGVWPAAGLYVDGAAAPASVEDETEEAVEPLTRMDISKDEIMSAEIMARFAAEANRKKNAAAQEVSDGSVNALRNTDTKREMYLTNPFRSAAAQTETGEEVTVSITETVAVTNGLFAVIYDPEVLTLAGTSSDLTYKSVFADEEKGVITFAYANKVELAAGTELLNVRFVPICEDAEIEINTLERKAETELSESQMIAIEGTGHVWGEAEYEWAEDNSTVTATIVCSNNAEHKIEETVNTSYAVTTQPGCDTAGVGTYTATFTNELFETKTKEVEIPATGHDWNDPVWTWAEDYSTAEATFICNRNSAHFEKIEADIDVEETETEYVYTATVTFEGQNYTDTMTVAKELDSDFIRIYRESRLTESIKVADELKNVLGVEKFDNIIIAKDSDFADALSGSYLATRKNAPILLVNNDNHEEAYDYIRSSLKERTGVIYILGADNAVSSSFEEGLKEDPYEIKRIEGTSRYMTNLDILKEAGMTSSGDIFVVTGASYADSLSSASVGLPILMVDNNSTSLKNSQKKFLQANVTGKVYILGDTNAVNASLEKQLKTYGKITRIGGSSRWVTTRLIAEKFFTNPEYVTLATGNDFADGLIASPLAYALKSPLIMCASDKTYQAKVYVQAHPVAKAYIVGSKDYISDAAARTILLLEDDVLIIER